MDPKRSNLENNPYPAPGNSDAEQTEYIEHQPARKEGQNEKLSADRNQELLDTDLEKDDPALQDHTPDDSN